MNKQLTQKDIIDFLRAEKDFFNKTFGVVAMGLFGSYANGTATQDSDIDLLIEFKEPRFEHLAGLQIFLEEKFKRKIEIVRKSDNLNNKLLKNIEKHTIFV